MSLKRKTVERYISEGKYGKREVWECEHCGADQSVFPSGRPQTEAFALDAEQAEQYMHHDALCVSRLDNPERMGETDKAKVLQTLFERASRLMGIAPEAAHKAMRRLYEYVPECGLPRAVKVQAKKEGWISGDENWSEIPFLSETYLYALLGKEDARTLLALVGAVATAINYDRSSGQ